MYTLDTCYRHIKTVSGLKIIVITAISAHDEHVHPYFCVVYSLSGAKSDEVVDILVLVMKTQSKVDSFRNHTFAQTHLFWLRLTVCFKMTLHQMFFISFSMSHVFPFFPTLYPLSQEI